MLNRIAFAPVLGYGAFVMSTLEALKAEIETAPEPLLRQAYDFVVFLKTREPAPHGPSAPKRWPDFAARRREIFGDAVQPDSQSVLDHLREDRF